MSDFKTVIEIFEFVIENSTPEYTIKLFKDTFVALREEGIIVRMKTDDSKEVMIMMLSDYDTGEIKFITKNKE